MMKIKLLICKKLLTEKILILLKISLPSIVELIYWTVIYPVGSPIHPRSFQQLNPEPLNVEKFLPLITQMESFPVSV